MRKKWNRETVIAEFKNFEASGESISPKNLRAKRNDLLVQIRRKFGTYRQFIESLGYDYEDVIGFRIWTKDRIITELQERERLGKSIMRADLERECPYLLSAAVKHFGTFKEAANACGFSYEDCLGFTWWSEEKVIAEFLKLYNDPEVRTITRICEVNKGLDHAVRKYFGSYDVLCDKLGLDVTAIRPEVYEWKPEDLLEVLRDCKEKGMPLNVMTVQSVFPCAVKVATRHFGSYAAALAQIGESYPEHEDDRIQSSRRGRDFERLVAEMLTVLMPNHTRHFRGFPGIIPDFYFEDTEEIVDAKLSSWSVFNCNTINNYMPFCKKLTIIYLRGPIIDHSVDNLELKPVSDFYETLERNGREDLIAQFENLRRTIQECAASTATTPEITVA